jgi:hypothetical protein
MTTHILLMKRSLLTPLPFFPWLFLGNSVHISLTFSRTMLQCLSNAFTRARSLRLLRHEMTTWLWLRTAVWRMERGPAVNSCSSTRAISYSLSGVLVDATEEESGWNLRELAARLLQKVAVERLALLDAHRIHISGILT